VEGNGWQSDDECWLLISLTPLKLVATPIPTHNGKVPRYSMPGVWWITLKILMSLYRSPCKDDFIAYHMSNVDPPGLRSKIEWCFMPNIVALHLLVLKMFYFSLQCILIFWLHRGLNVCKLERIHTVA
jgi:hypothetical protein